MIFWIEFLWYDFESNIELNRFLAKFRHWIESIWVSNRAIAILWGLHKDDQDECCEDDGDDYNDNDDGNIGGNGDVDEYLTRSSSPSSEKSTEAEDYRSLVLLRSSSSSSSSS